MTQHMKHKWGILVWVLLLAAGVFFSMSANTQEQVYMDEPVVVAGTM